MKTNSIFLKVGISLVLAVIAGLITGSTMEIFGVPFVDIYHLIGQLFLNALTLVVMPLVVSSIITGVARMGAEESVGALGMKTFGYFIATSLTAVLVGFVFVTLLSPGIPPDSKTFIPTPNTHVEALGSYAEGGAFSKIEHVLLQIIPSNVLAAASKGQILGLILFSMLFGFFSARIEPTSSSIVLGFWKGIFQIMMSITHLVMKALPIGVFGLVAQVMATTGLKAMESVAFFFVTVILALLVYAGVLLPLVLKTFAKINPVDYFRAMAPALFTAFSTSSSAATLPITIECVEKRVGISNRISGFTIPLGASINLSGSALFQCVAVFFIVQAYGVELTFGTQFIVILMSLLTSFGLAGIPSASLVSVVVILQSIGLPADGIALILAVERILDMFRSSVNVFGNAACAVLVASSEGEKIPIAS